MALQSTHLLLWRENSSSHKHEWGHGSHVHDDEEHFEELQGCTMKITVKRNSGKLHS